MIPPDNTWWCHRGYWFINRYRMWHSQGSHFQIYSHSFCVLMLKGNQRRRSYLLRNFKTSKSLRSMLKNASNLTGLVQKLLKIEGGVGPKFHNKDDLKESLWLWITRGTPPVVRVVPHRQGDAQWGRGTHSEHHLWWRRQWQSLSR